MYFNPQLNNLSFTTLGRYLTYYYKAWFKKRPLQLLLEFEDFRQKVEPFNDETFDQFGDDAFKFWGYVEGDYKELAAVALKLFGMCVNAASVERMWSLMGFLHTVRRNRLTVSFHNLIFILYLIANFIHYNFSNFIIIIYFLCLLRDFFSKLH